MLGALRCASDPIHLIKMILYDDFLTELPLAHQYERYIQGLCPFHSHSDNTPSLLVFRDGWFRCLNCGKNGTWLVLWNKLKGQPVQVAPERKTAWNTPKVNGDELEEVCYEAHADLLHFPSLGWYLEMRGIEGRIESNELGYWDGWYTFPVYDSSRKFITAVFRAAPHIQEATGLRYWCHHNPVLFVPDWGIVERNSYLYVVFGTIDALVLSDLRLPVVTSTGGKDSFKAEWLDMYRKPIIIIPDKGEEETAMRLASQLGWRGRVLRMNYPEGIKDPAGFYEAHKKQELLSILGKETTV